MMMISVTQAFSRDFMTLFGELVCRYPDPRDPSNPYAPLCPLPISTKRSLDHRGGGLSMGQRGEDPKIPALKKA